MSKLNADDVRQIAQRRSQARNAAPNSVAPARTALSFAPKAPPAPAPPAPRTLPEALPRADVDIYATDARRTFARWNHASCDAYTVARELATNAIAAWRTDHKSADRIARVRETLADLEAVVSRTREHEDAAREELGQGYSEVRAQTRAFARGVEAALGACDRAVQTEARLEARRAILERNVVEGKAWHHGLIQRDIAGNPVASNLLPHDIDAMAEANVGSPQLRNQLRIAALNFQLEIDKAAAFTPSGALAVALNDPDLAAWEAGQVQLDKVLEDAPERRAKQAEQAAERAERDAIVEADAPPVEAWKPEVA